MSARKDDDARVNRNPIVHNIGALEWDGETRGPELPDDVNWCSRTREWWDTWRNSPQAMLMTNTDWEEMLVTARLHNYMWGKHIAVNKLTGEFGEVECSPSDAKSLASEIRIRLEKMGATIKDRGSLGMRLQTSPADVIRDAEQALQAAVDYRKALMEGDD